MRIEGDYPDMDVLDDIVDTLERDALILHGFGDNCYRSETMSGLSADVILADGRNATIMVVIH